MLKYSKSPWYFTGFAATGGGLITASNGEKVAVVMEPAMGGVMDRLRRNNDATLMAAAPQLLAEAKEVLEESKNELTLAVALKKLRIAVAIPEGAQGYCPGCARYGTPSCKHEKPEESCVDWESAW